MTSVSTANYAYQPPSYGNTYSSVNTAQMSTSGAGSIVGDTYVSGSGFSDMASMVSAAAGGGFAAFKMGGTMGSQLRGMFGGGSSVSQNLQQVGAQMGKSMNVSTLLSKGPQGAINALSKDMTKYAGKNVQSQISGGSIFKGLGGAVLTGLKGTALSALVGAGVSAAVNGVGVATGSVSSDRAIDNVIGDTISATVGGMGAMAAAGIGNAIMGSFGLAGTPLLIATTALGAIGGAAAFNAKNLLLD